MAQQQIQKVCPILSVAIVGKESAITVPGKKANNSPILCLGANCAFWHQIAVATPQGIQTMEGCAISHIASGLMAVRQGIDMAAQPEAFEQEEAKPEEKPATP